MSAEDALRLAATAQADALRHALSRCGRGSTAYAILRSALHQCDADVVKAVAALAEPTAHAGAHDVDVLDEVLGPLYVSLERYDDVDRLLVREPAAARYRASRKALAAVLAGVQGDAAAARTGRAEARELLASCDDELLTGFVYQRCGLSAYFSGDVPEAVDGSLQAARTLSRIGAHRGAATAYSVLYAVHYTITGDAEAAYEFARLQVDAARSCGSTSVEIAGLVAQYELAAELGDEATVLALRAAIRRKRLPQQFHERFAHGVADALPHAWHGDFTTFRANVLVLRQVHSRTPQEKALCVALGALADAALGDTETARRDSRHSLSLSSTKAKTHLQAHDLRYARLARGIAASVCVLIGDGTRARRAFDAQSLRADPASASLRTVLEGAPWTAAAARIRGFARALAAARDAVGAREARSSALTPAESRVLELIADGLSAPAIARELDRSVYTVRVHTRSIITKFNVHNRLAAVARARRLGYLP